MGTFNGTREAFVQAITDLSAVHEDVVFISSDSLKAMRAVPYAERFPKKYIEVGIAEQGAVATAAGMAASGHTPFVGTYGGFLTMRACEQMRTFVAYPNLNVKFVGINGGLVGGEREGVTHQFYEELSILSAIPNFKLFVPADGAQTYHAVKLAYETPGPVFIRAGSGKEPDVYDMDKPFNPDGVSVLRDYGTDAVLFANGFILDNVLKAADHLQEQGTRVTVADVNILYANESSKIVSLLQSSKRVFTIEDHNVNGGLGSYICHLACQYHPIHVERIGMRTFGESGMPDVLVDHYGLSTRAIIEQVRQTS